MGPGDGSGGEGVLPSNHGARFVIPIPEVQVL
jgi:hypothetical protein